jgi:tetratricopeptide (TPR) repeat protein
MFAGRFDEGLRELKAAIRVNPFDLGLLMNEGEFLIWARRPREAVMALEKTLDIGPHFWPARLRLARLLASEGNHADARREHESALEHAPPTRRQSSEALLLATMGEADKALRELASLEAARNSRAVSALDLARGFGLIGNAPRATHWIDVCIDERAPMLLALGIDVSFDRIRHHADFQRRVELSRRPSPSIP